MLTRLPETSESDLADLLPDWWKPTTDFAIEWIAGDPWGWPDGYQNLARAK